MNRNLSSFLIRNFLRYNSTTTNFLPKYLATKILLDAKRKSNLKFADLATKLNVNKVSFKFFIDLNNNNIGFFFFSLL